MLPTAYQQGYNDGNGYDTGDSEQGGGGRRWLPWTIAGVVLVPGRQLAVYRPYEMTTVEDQGKGPRNATTHASTIKKIRSFRLTMFL